MEKTIGIALGIYALILWVLVVFVWHKGYKEWKTNRANRVRPHKTRIVNKREAETPARSEWLVCFEYNGRQVEFQISPEVYASVKIGEEGTLYLHGDGRFERFEPKTQDERVDEVYRRMVKD